MSWNNGMGQRERERESEREREWVRASKQACMHARGKHALLHHLWFVVLFGCILLKDHSVKNNPSCFDQMLNLLLHPHDTCIRQISLHLRILFNSSKPSQGILHNINWCQSLKAVKLHTMSTYYYYRCIRIRTVVSFVGSKFLSTIW